MGLKIALLSRDNGVGLSLDANLLKVLFSEAGHEVEFRDWQAGTMPRVDVAIHLELISRSLAQCADRNIAILNLEWYPKEWLKFLPAFDQIWAKSRYAYDFCRMRGGRNVHLTGFLGRDIMDSSVKRNLSCLHLRGKSMMKGTDQVIAAWQRNPGLPPLTIVSKEPVKAPSHVSVVYSPSDRDLVRMMNEAKIHVCPSTAEGWGHYITEAMSVGAIVVTTDASPMNEHIKPDWGYLLGVRSVSRHHQAEQTFTAPQYIEEAVLRAAALSPESRHQVGSLARRHFLDRNAEFRKIALELIKK